MDQGLTVWNPGHFPPPITAALLRQEHPSVPSNPLVARALYLAGYIEEWGTGTLRVVEAMRAHGNPEPIFEEDPQTGIRVILPLTGVAPSRLSPRQSSLLRARTGGQTFTTAEHAAEAGVAHRTALQDLRDLEALGLVRRSGRGKATRWTRL
jgi:ATP-dependent DNA helicase RecG